MIKKPVIMSLTRLCAPKPIARPTTPAPASSVDTGILNDSSIATTIKNQMKMDALFCKTLISVLFLLSEPFKRDFALYLKKFSIRRFATRVKM